MSDELKPCRRCGQQPVYMSDPDGVNGYFHGHAVGCQKCSTVNSCVWALADSKDGAFAEWNKWATGSETNGEPK